MLTSEYFASDKPRKRHRKKAYFGMTFGVLLVMGGAIGGYYTFPAESATASASAGALYVLLMLPGIAISLWGCAHFARHRGYPSYAALGLYALGVLVLILLPPMQTKFTFCFIFVFATLLPFVVLMALPEKKVHRTHRRRRRPQPTLDRF